MTSKIKGSSNELFIIDIKRSWTANHNESQYSMYTISTVLDLVTQMHVQFYHINIKWHSVHELGTYKRKIQSLGCSL